MARKAKQTPEPEVVETAVVAGIKGFDKDFRCRGFQFEPGKTYEEPGKPVICQKGFHYCTNPLDIFGYYPPADSRFGEVEGIGETVTHSEDSKVACSKIHIKAEIGLSALIGAGIKFVFNRVDWTKAEQTTDAVRGAASATGVQGAASATGVRGAASATGVQGAASATGVQGAASATGDEGCAVSLGIEGKAKGAKGAWLTLAEWKQDKKYDWHRVNVQTVQVDGKKIKADTFYSLVSGKFVESK